MIQPLVLRTSTADGTLIARNIRCLKINADVLFLAGTLFGTMSNIMIIQVEDASTCLKINHLCDELDELEVENHLALLEIDHVYDIFLSTTRIAIHPDPCLHDYSKRKVAKPSPDECVLIAFTIAVFELFSET